MRHERQGPNGPALFLPKEDVQDVTPCLHALVIEWQHDAADRFAAFLRVGSLDGIVVDVE